MANSVPLGWAIYKKYRGICYSKSVPCPLDWFDLTSQEQAVWAEMENTCYDDEEE